MLGKIQTPLCPLENWGGGAYSSSGNLLFFNCTLNSHSCLPSSGFSSWRYPALCTILSQIGHYSGFLAQSTMTQGCVYNREL